MQEPQEFPSRKKFLLAGVAAFCSALAVRLGIRGSRKAEAGETVKMLTEDGQLVEVNKTMLASRGKKITNGELQKWIKNRPVNK